MGKVHVIPTGFEFDRIVRGLEEFGVSRIYLLRGTGDVERHVEPIVRKLRERYSYLIDEGNLIEVHTDFHDLASIFRAVRRIIEVEGPMNEVLINISTSSRLMVAALLMAAWSSDTSKLLRPPVLYYVVPKEYLYPRLLTLRERIEKMLDSLDGMDRDQIRVELEKVSEEIGLLERGLSSGARGVVTVPFMPIKPPSDYELRILRALEEAGGEVSSIKELAEIVEGRNRGRSTRSKVVYHLEKLVEKGLVEKSRWEGGVSVRLTELGEVFV